MVMSGGLNTFYESNAIVQTTSSIFGILAPFLGELLTDAGK